jgi:hypothetical protein
MPEGARIRNAAIIDQESNSIISQLVRDGELVGNPNQTFKIVTLSFLADGGDGYPFPTGPSVNRVDLYDLDANQVPDEEYGGLATFAPNGTEQDALAEYLATFFPADSDPTTPVYGDADQGRMLDERIQNLDFREDSVFFGNRQGNALRSPNAADPGTRGRQILVGTSDDEIIDGGDGPASLTGGGGRDIFMLNPGPGVVRITDFMDGTDFLALPDGLAFGDLAFTGNANSGARISVGSDLLAVLEGVAPNTLTEADFAANVLA